MTRKIRGLLFLSLFLLIAALFSLCIGRLSVTPGQVWQSISGHITGGDLPSKQTELVLWKIRMPRILLAMLAGAGLSVSGCAFQSLFANPLATPDTLGVASGASFGAALALLFGAGMISVQISSILFGILAVVLTVLTGSGRKGKGLSGIVLGGIMIGSLFSALISLVKFSADTDDQLPAITFWLMGSLSSANYKSLAIGAPVILTGILILYLLRWRLNLLPLNEEEARATGVNIRVLQGVTILCATGITASVISMCGQVGWVGLLVPHICRMIFGSNHTELIPASILAGGGFLIVVDTLARSVSASELPISILTAIIGAPFFIFLMRRNEGDLL